MAKLNLSTFKTLIGRIRRSCAAPDHTGLVKMLRRAHAIEVGAFNAYEGHWRSLPHESFVSTKIRQIQSEELSHKISVEWMLMELCAKPSYFQDFLIGTIGKVISLMCYISPGQASLAGAMFMEILGGNVYHDLAVTALLDGRKEMSDQLLKMARAEEEHERYFRGEL